MMYYLRAARVHNLGERMIQKVHGENKVHGFLHIPIYSNTDSDFIRTAF